MKAGAELCVPAMVCISSTERISIFQLIMDEYLVGDPGEANSEGDSDYHLIEGVAPNLSQSSATETDCTESCPE